MNTQYSQTATIAAEAAPAIYERVRNQSPSYYGPDKPGEIWKPLVEFNGRFEVSNLGRIRSLQRPCVRNFGVGRPSGRILQPTINKKGYQQLIVLFQKKPVCVRIHRAVATAFLPNPSALPMVRHKDANRVNNQVENLEWTDRRQRLHRDIDSGTTDCQQVYSSLDGRHSASVGMEGQGHV